MITFELSTDYDLLNWMDTATFLLDERPHFESDTMWWIGRQGDMLACFCAWKPTFFKHMNETVGFHYRAGVLEGFRGCGLQKQMVRLREDSMRNADINLAVTYTDADNAASMRSLIGCGYRPYQATEHSCLSGGLARMGRVGFVHWDKIL